MRLEKKIPAQETRSLAPRKGYAKNEENSKTMAMYCRPQFFHLPKRDGVAWGSANVEAANVKHILRHRRCSRETTPHLASTCR